MIDGHTWCLGVAGQWSSVDSPLGVRHPSNLPGRGGIDSLIATATIHPEASSRY